MRLYSSIALAAVAAVLVTPVAAEAKTKRHHHAAAAAATEGLSTAEELRLAQEQISQLQAQLNALAGRLDQTAAASQQQAAVAQQTAVAASSKADTALAKADAVKVEEVKTQKAVKAVDWAAGTKVGGQIFFNASEIDAKGYGATGNARKTLEKDGAFQIKRAYITVDHTFNKTFAVDITADVDPVVANKTITNTTPAALNNTDEGFYIKYAYLQATIDPALVIRLGSAASPWIPFVDGIEGHRYVDKNLVDQFKLGNSADWGVHVSGNLLNKIVSYDIAAVTGAGYKDPQNSNHVDVEGRISASYLGFTAGVGGYTGKLAASELGVATTLTASRINALAAYQGKLEGVGFTLGGEYVAAKNFSASLLTAGTPDKERGLALFGSISPIEKWSVFGRYNWIRSSALLHPANADHAFFAGIQYEPVKYLDLSLVYKHDSADGKFSTAGNPVVYTYSGFSGGNVGTNVASRNEIGLYGNVKF